MASNLSFKLIILFRVRLTVSNRVRVETGVRVCIGNGVWVESVHVYRQAVSRRSMCNACVPAVISHLNVRILSGGSMSKPRPTKSGMSKLR